MSLSEIAKVVLDISSLKPGIYSVQPTGAKPEMLVVRP